MSNIDFPTWMERVDAMIESVLGLTHEDLPDKPWNAWFHTGMRAAEAAREALADEGFDDESDF